MASPVETCKIIYDALYARSIKPETVFEYASCLELAAKCEETTDVYITAAYYPAVFTQAACRTAVPAGHLKLFLERIGATSSVPAAPATDAPPATPSTAPAPEAPATEAPLAAPVTDAKKNDDEQAKKLTTKRKKLSSKRKLQNKVTVDLEAP